MIERYPYQIEGARWLATKQHALLADEMGLGKTIQAIDALDLVGARGVIVVCPAAARTQWGRQFETLAPQLGQPRVVMGGSSLAGGSGPLIVSYDWIVKNSKSLPKSFDAAVLDEAHYCKEPTSKRAKIAFGTLAHRATRTWCLSGTPAPNHVGELWTLLRTFGLTQAKHDDFVREHCLGYDDGFRFKPTGTRDPEGFRRKFLSGIMLRRMKHEVATQLPPLRFDDVYVDAVELTESTWIQHFQREALQGAQDFMLQKVKRETDVLEAAMRGKTYDNDRISVIEALAPALPTLRRYTGMVKCGSVVPILAEELANNAYPKIVLFALHRGVIEELRQGLKDFGAITLWGETPAKDRQARIDKFVKDPKCRVFIGQIKAAGTAIDGLQAVCDEVMFVEYDWVPANNAQAVMRLHRIGQQNRVRARIAILAGSPDEKVLAAVRRKTKDLAGVFDRPSLLD